MVSGKGYTSSLVRVILYCIWMQLIGSKVEKYKLNGNDNNYK